MKFVTIYTPEDHGFYDIVHINLDDVSFIKVGTLNRPTQIWLKNGHGIDVDEKSAILVDSLINSFNEIGEGE